MPWEIRRKPDPAKVADEYQKMVDNWVPLRSVKREDRQATLRKLRALKDPTAEQVEAIIGADNWTAIKCDICRKPQDALVAIDAKRGEQEVELCADCLREMLAALGAALVGR